MIYTEANLPEELDNVLVEYYSNRIDMLCEDYVLEGSNADINKSFKANFKIYKNAMKAGSKAKKAGDIKEAKSQFKAAQDAAQDILEECKKAAKDETLIESLAGFTFWAFYLGLLQGAITLLMSLTVIGAPVAGLAGAGAQIQGLIQAFKDIKNKDDASFAKFINRYRHQIVTWTSLLLKVAQKAEQKADAVKESFLFSDYESFVESATETEESFDEDFNVEIDETLALYAERYYDQQLDKLNEQFEADLLMEGANDDYTELFKKAGDIYQTKIKEGKRLQKSGDIKGAKKCFSEAKKAAQDIEKDLDAVMKDESVGESILGFIIGKLLKIAYSICIGIISGTGILTIVGSALGLAENARRIWGLIIIFKDMGKEQGNILAFVNSYRNMLRQTAKLLYKIADKCEQKVGTVNESTLFEGDLLFDF